MENLVSLITVNPKKRFGNPCVCDTRVTAGDVLGWLASGKVFDEIRANFDPLTQLAIA